MPQYFTITYFLIFLLYSAALVCEISKKVKTASVFLLIGLVFTFALLVLVTITSRQLPFFNLFESFLMTVFILGGLGAFCTRPTQNFAAVRVWVWMEMVIILGVILPFPKEPSSYAFNHDYLFVNIFHGMRIVSLASIIFSSAHFFQSFIDQKNGAYRPEFVHRGRNFLALSTLCFLISEYAGIIWCQKGWGDVWMWGTNFFQSAVIILWLMLALHLPSGSRRTDMVKVIIRSMSGLVLLTLFVIRGILG